MKGKEKSPFSDSLATEENGLGFENLNQRLQRYAGAKSRALDMADYIKTEEVSNNENRKLVKKLGDCASYLVFKHYYTENKVILHGMAFAVSSYCVRSVRFVGLPNTLKLIGTRWPL